MAKCKHVNKQSFGPDGLPDKLECSLEEGHEGNHRAAHMEIEGRIGLESTVDEGRETITRTAAGGEKERYLIAKREVEWTSAAG